MTEITALKPKAYMVSAAFGQPPASVLFANACIAPSSEAAVAMCVALFCQESGTRLPIQGINCMELTEAFMADALTAIRGGEKPKVVSLREVETPAAEPAPTLAPTIFEEERKAHDFVGGPGFDRQCRRCGLWESRYILGDTPAPCMPTPAA